MKSHNSWSIFLNVCTYSCDFARVSRGTPPTSLYLYASASTRMKWSKRQVQALVKSLASVRSRKAIGSSSLVATGKKGRPGARIPRYKEHCMSNCIKDCTTLGSIVLLSDAVLACRSRIAFSTCTTAGSKLSRKASKCAIRRTHTITKSIGTLLAPNSDCRPLSALEYWSAGKFVLTRGTSTPALPIVFLRKRSSCRAPRALTAYLLHLAVSTSHSKSEHEVQSIGDTVANAHEVGLEMIT